MPYDQFREYELTVAIECLVKSYGKAVSTHLPNISGRPEADAKYLR